MLIAMCQTMISNVKIVMQFNEIIHLKDRAKIIMSKRSNMQSAKVKNGATNN